MRDGVDYADVDLTDRVALVFGNEAAGLSDDVLTALDVAVTIPMAGRAESLNVSVSAAVLCFEVLRQRRKGGESQRPSGESQRPSGESQRPSGESQRPSGEGQRPSGESQRPSGESQRPSGESQRPSGESQQGQGNQAEHAGQRTDAGAAGSTMPEMETRPAGEETDGGRGPS